MWLKKAIIRIKVGLEKLIPDSVYLKLFYKRMTGKKLNLKNPNTISEKLQWMKLHNRNPLMTVMVDKYEGKKYVEKIIGSKYIIKTIGIYNSFDDINFSSLPNQFVIKCTHDNKSTLVCKDKYSFDFKFAKQFINKHLRTNFYWWGREWPYKNVKPRIIIEEYIQNPDGSNIVDYKFYCYGGKPRYFMYSLGEVNHNVRNHKFSMDGRSIDYLFKKKPTVPLTDIILPSNLDEMITIVEKLCQSHQHIRIDLYNVSGRIFFGEQTFYSGSGIINIDNKDYAQSLSNLIDLSKI